MHHPEFADALLQQQEAIIQSWLEKIAATPSLAALIMTPVLRRDHAYQLLGDVALRLRGDRTIRASSAAQRYAEHRAQLGYTPEMDAQELALLALVARNAVAAQTGRDDLLPLLTELLAEAHHAVVVAVRLEPPASTSPPVEAAS